MERRRFGPTQSQVPLIGQGTWEIGRSGRASALAALRRGLDLGMTHIDTAEMYGVAEDVVGEAIAGRRDEVFLVSKVLPSNASRRGTVAACAKSLARLKTDRLDCYLLHWPGEQPLEETIAAREREALRQDSEQQMERLQRKAQRDGEGLMAGLRAKVQPFIDAVMRDRGLELVLDREACVAVAASIDVTDEVIGRADESQREAQQPASEGPVAAQRPSSSAPGKP